MITINDNRNDSSLISQYCLSQLRIKLLNSMQKQRHLWLSFNMGMLKILSNKLTSKFFLCTIYFNRLLENF